MNVQPKVAGRSGAPQQHKTIDFDAQGFRAAAGEPRNGTSGTARVGTKVDPAKRPPLGEIFQRYQVGETSYGDQTYRFGIIPLASKKLTAGEGQLINKLNPFQLGALNDIKEKARKTAEQYYPHKTNAGTTNGHQDAFRHTLWSALTSEKFGQRFGKALTTAHEQLPGNYAASEAMDLHNNEVGHRIAAENPRRKGENDAAYEKRIAGVVNQALKNGNLIVIAKGEKLAWSDQVKFGDHETQLRLVGKGGSYRGPDLNANPK
jgi:hypothetical protein